VSGNVAHSCEDYLDVETERRDRRAIKKAATGRGGGRESGVGIASGRARLESGFDTV
jgi:hypothetical protein